MTLRSLVRSLSLSLKFAACTVALLIAPIAARSAQAQATSFATTAVGSTAATVAVPVTFAHGGTIAGIRVLTSGVAQLDYTNASVSTDTCSVNAGFLASQTCTLTVQFKPTAPGERRGAVVLLDSSSNVLGLRYLDALAQGSLGVMLPGIINTVAGNGSWLYNGDGGQAVQAQLFLPLGIAVDGAGNFYVADSSNNRIRRIDAVTNMISTVAGNGSVGFSGDGGLAINAALNNPTGLAIDGAGNLYIADSNNNAIRVVSAFDGTIKTIAGTGGHLGYAGDNAAATLALLNTPNGLAFDSNSNLYIADTGNSAIRKVNAAGTITTIAGTGTAGLTGDNGAATAARLDAPWGLAISPAGTLYIADTNNSRIRKVSGGVISTFAGTTPGPLGDGQSALQAQLNIPAGVALDVAGNLYIADAGNNRVRKINAVTGIINTIAGTGAQVISGDGGAADQAGLYGPYALALDGAGNLFIADMFHNRVREISATQSIQNYAAIRVGRVSDPQPQIFENDGNVAMHFSSLAGVTNGAVDSASTCTTATPLAAAVSCTIGAEFAPTETGHSVLGSIAVASDAANTPGTITLQGEVDALEPTSVSLTTSAATVAVGTSVTFSSTVTSNGAAPTGKIKFMDGTNLLSTVTMSSSSASYTTTALGIGAHTITAVYSGDASNSANTSAAVVETVKQTSTTSLTTSATNVVANTNITFTATVHATVTATGSVIFNDGSTPIGNGSLDGNGVATLTLSTLTPGPHTISAAYQGDTQSLTSTSSTVSETVQALTTTIVTASANPASAGAKLTFTATVGATGSNQSTGAITGTVTFMDGSATLGTGAVNSSGVATYQTSTLALGSHTITASYAGATYYASSASPTLNQTVQQAATTALLASSANPSIVNATVTITATVAGTGAAPTGTVIFKDAGTQIGQGAVNAQGKATMTNSTFTVGSHAITAEYSGDTNNVASTSSAMSQVVNKAVSATALVATPNPSSQGVYVQFTAVVTSNGTAPTGTVLFMEGSNTLGSGTLDAQGVATYNTNALGMGQHTIVAVYQGDTANNASSSASLSQNVLPATGVTLTSSRNPGIAGAAVIFTAAVSGQGAVPTGTVTFKDGATVLGTGTLNAQGSTTYSSSSLSVGAHSITATYAGDAANASSTSLLFAQTIQQATTQAVLNASALSITRGSGVTLTATVSGNGGMPAGSVNFTDNAQPLGTVSLANGVATLTNSTLTVGQHSIAAAYAGDTNNQGSSSTVIVETVTQASPIIQVNSGVNPSLVGTGVTFTMTLQHGVATPQGTITWYDGTTPLGSSALSNNTSTFTANGLAVGAHSITAAYSGDANNAAVTSGVLAQNVQQATTVVVQSNANQTIAGLTVHFTATVTGNSGNAVTGTVTFKDGSLTLGTGALVNGAASFDALSLLTGLHVITAVYSGDAGSQASTSAPWTQSVTAATTQVTLASSLNPSLLGGPVTLTATVTGNGQAATGTVTFKDGATVLGTATINGGLAVYTTTSLATGQHALMAVYGGDANNSTASSSVLTETVQQRTSIAVVSGTNPALTAESIILTATVTNGGSTAATGTVSFNDGGTVLGSAALDSNGVATFPVSSLTAGQHGITATYNGDTFNLTSTSAAITEAVQLRASTTSLAVSSTNLTSNQVLTLFAAVQGTGVLTPTGTVSFYAGSTMVGTATLASTGVATLNYTPAAGSYTITAKYVGDAVYATSTSAVSNTITVGQTTQFSMVSNPSSLSVESKKFSTLQVTMTSTSSFTDTLELGCLGLPSGATCTFDKTTVALAANGSQTVNVTLDTSDPINAGGKAQLETKGNATTLACGLPLGIAFGLLLWFKRRNARALGGLLMLALVVMTFTVTGCGALQINGVAPGTYNVKVVATGAHTGITQSADITLTVTQ